MKKPAISVLIPVYNVEKYLDACLQSVADQTFQDIEIICINDGSTDNSANILSIWTQKEPRLKVLSQENQGVAITRNHLLQAAKGKYVAFVDSDDLIAPTYLEKLYQSAEQARADISLCESVTVDSNFVLTGDFLFEEMKKDLRPTRTLLQRLNYAYHNGLVWGRLFRHQFIIDKKLSFVPGRVAEDFFFGLLALLEAGKVSYVPQQLYLYRRGVTGSITTQNARMMVDKYAHIFTLREEMQKRGFWTKLSANWWMHRLVRRVLGLYKLSSQEQIEHSFLFKQAITALSKTRKECSWSKRLKWEIFLVGVRIFPTKVQRLWWKLFR